MRRKRRTRRRRATNTHRNKRRRGITRRNKRKRRTKRRVKRGGSRTLNSGNFEKNVMKKLDEIENYITQNQRCLGLVKKTVSPPLF